MNTNPFRITIHMVASLDGMIAKKDNSVAWFESTSAYDKGIAAPDTAAFLKTIDCYVMGATTYEHALNLSKTYGWAYGDTPTIVVTHRNLPAERQRITLYSGDLTKLVNEQLTPQYKNVWVVGGPTLAKDFLRLQLADEIRITVLPVILGNGIPFFDDSLQEQALQLENVSAYKNGMVELHYQIRK